MKFKNLGNFLPATILTLAVFAGQLIKLPLNGSSGATLLDLVVAAFCIFGSLQIRFKLKKPPIEFFYFFLFCLLGFISLAFTPLKLTFTETAVSLSYGLRFFLYVYLGWLLYSDALNSLTVNISKILIASGLILSIAGLLQLIFIPNLLFLASSGWDPHYFRTVSTFLDPNFFGGFISLVLIFILVRFRKIDLSDKFLVTTFIICFLALLTTFSRSAAICFIVSSFTLSLLKKSIRHVFLTIIFIAFFGIAFLAYHQFVATPRNIDRGKSASYRLGSYQEGLKIWEHSPVFGIGFNSYRYALREYKLAGNAAIQSHGGSTNDSSFLYIIDTTGLLGLLSFILGLFYVFKRSFKDKNVWGVYFIAGATGLIAQSFIINILFYPWILLWIFLTISRIEN